jgi:flagellar basal-body rod protein FlgB
MIRSLFDSAVEQLSRGLAFAGARHEVVARNIANADTPGYRAHDLVLDDVLRPQAVTAPGEVAASLLPLGEAERRPRLIFTGPGTPRTDVSDVDVEQQLSHLSENQLFHGALVQMLTNHFTALKMAISGRV